MKIVSVLLGYVWLIISLKCTNKNNEVNESVFVNGNYPRKLKSNTQKNSCLLFALEIFVLPFYLCFHILYLSIANLKIVLMFGLKVFFQFIHTQFCLCFGLVDK